MKFLRATLDKLEPLFHEGGKLERLYPLYEAADTFLYTPADVTKGASHVRDGMDLKRMMIFVVIALTPCILFGCYNTGLQTHLVAQQAAEAGVAAEDIVAQLGWRAEIMTSLGWTPESGGNPALDFVHGLLYFLPLFLITNAVGGGWEVLFCIIRKHEINEGFLVTGMLFPLTLPATMPLWQAAIGISFGVVIGKEVFGGTGKNFLNPALTARAYLYFAAPLTITGDAVWAGMVDGVTSPTMLTTLGSAKNVLPGSGSFDAALLALGSGGESLQLSQAFFGFIPGSIGETSTFCCLLGAAFLVATGVGSWRIMVGVLIGSMGLATILYGAESTTNAVYQIPPQWHLCIGGMAFGLVFMATDPVSAAMTDKGRWVYGILIGMMTIIIRVLNPAFPEGIMLAILMANVFAPVIDFVVVQQNINRRLARDES